MAFNSLLFKTPAQRQEEVAWAYYASRIQTMIESVHDELLN